MWVIRPQKDPAYQLIDSVLTTIPGINIDTLTVNGLTHLPNVDPAWGNACQTLFVDMFKEWKKNHYGKMFISNTATHLP